MNEVVKEFNKAYQIASKKVPEVQMRKTDLGCFCGDSDKPRYSMAALNGDPLVICEDCVSYFMDSVRPLMKNLGTVFPMSIYTIVADIHLLEGKLKKVKEWTPSYFEYMRDLCCKTSEDISHFNRLFKPGYLEI